MKKTKQKSSIWKTLRIAILLFVLIIVAKNVWQDNNQDWRKPIFVALYPINGDQTAHTQNYIDKLQEQDYLPIVDYLQSEAVKYQQPVQFYFKLGQEVKILPPALPEGKSVFSVMLWSLKFRYYTWKQQQDLGIKSNLTLFLKYYDPALHRELKHSTALQNGRMGIVNLFASDKQNAQNQIVIAHEMLHAFGATDKYDLSTGQPIYPQGYGDPQQSPRYPQKTAELMAGHIALSEQKSKMAESFRQVVINTDTAKEVGWLTP